MTEHSTPDSSESPFNSTSSRRAGSRGAFPRFAIPKVLPLVEAIWSEGHGEEVRTTAAFAKIGKAPNSGASRQLIAAANSGYGLITGNAGATYLGLTEKGKKVASHESDSRSGAVVSALFRNPIFSAIHTRYLDKPLPSDQVVSDYIKSSFSLSDDGAKACWGVVQENLKFAGLLTREGNNDVIIKVSNLSAPSFSNDADSTPTASPPEENSGSQLGSSYNPGLVGTVPRVAAEIHFNVQIHLPGDSTPESYDAIFASIAKHLLGRAE